MIWISIYTIGVNIFVLFYFLLLLSKFDMIPNEYLKIQLYLYTDAFKWRWFVHINLLILILFYIIKIRNSISISISIDIFGIKYGCICIRINDTENVYLVLMILDIIKIVYLYSFESRFSKLIKIQMNIWKWLFCFESNSIIYSN